MTPRLASGVQVSALLRQIEAQGGTGAVLAKGDAMAGAVLVLLAERGMIRALRERGLQPDGRAGWIVAGPADPGDPEALGAYLERRRRSDPDLWILELDGDFAALEAALAVA